MEWVKDIILKHIRTHKEDKEKATDGDDIHRHANMGRAACLIFSDIVTVARNNVPVIRCSECNAIKEITTTKD